MKNAGPQVSARPKASLWEGGGAAVGGDGGSL